MMTIDEFISWLKNYAQTQDDTERVSIAGYGHLYVIVINGAHDCSESEKVLARIEQDDVGKARKAWAHLDMESK